MATIQDAPNLTVGDLALYCANDEYFSTVFVFHGPVTTSAVTSSSRIQLIIFTLAGFQKYPRITLSPTSPLYAAVNHLPREKQGDEVCRGLAVGILKYFAELTEPIKTCLIERAKRIRGVTRVPRMFDEMHAAEIANKMAKVENAPHIIACLQAAYMEKKVPWLDMDLILPQGSIQPASLGGDAENEVAGIDSLSSQFGMYAPIVQLFGEPVFLPTLKLRRAPSQPTNVSKARQFSPQQKEALRLAMCEVVDTEERYVSKLYELVHSVIDDFRAKAKTKSATSTSPNEGMLAQLFPPCLDQILKVNMGFLGAIRDVLESSEQEAMEDIEKGADTPSDLKRRRDPQGAAMFAKVLIEWFPKFSQPYRDYMQAHGGFSNTLNLFLKDQNSSFSRRIYETGEQKIRSMLMEPIQRLPRYSLLIDAMTNTLPSSHAALRLLLKARDMITEICSLDSAEDDGQEQAVDRLQNKVSMWPSALRPTGRLITAVDVAELTAGYIPPDSSDGTGHEMLLLFPEMLVLLKKGDCCTLSARGFLAEMEKRSQSPKAPVQDEDRLLFVECFFLATTQTSQSACGNVLYLNHAQSSTSRDSSMSRHLIRAFHLLGADEGKAYRFLEETVKARFEYRFSEKERESGKWTLLAHQASLSSFNLMTAICEDGEFCDTRRGKGSAVFSLEKQDRPMSNSSDELHISIIATMSTGGRYRVEISHACGKSTDVVSLEDLRPMLLKRLAGHLRTLNSFQNAAFASAIVEANEAVHQTLEFRTSLQTKNPRGFRPPSPTKFLASLWSGGREPTSKTDTAGTPNGGLVFPPPQLLSSRQEQPEYYEEDSSTKIKSIAPESTTTKDSLHQLEQTFTAYILALRSRRGNIVGRSLRGRLGADQVAVNDLYNILLDDASKIQAAAEVSVDVLIAAFEKFLVHGWKDRLGPIITPEQLRIAQKKFEKQFPADFETFFKSFLSDLAPQNRRAFTALVRLLTDLLDASGNDGDRGALTATFTELLAGSNDSLQYMSLLDRLVEDYERLFDDSVPIGWPAEKDSLPDTGGSNNMSNKSKNGSISSQTSSFRKRFGFGLSRNNSSKDDSESKVSSIIRSLSKNKESNSQPSSLSKGSLIRSKSTDSDSRIAALLRPVSRDRAPFNGTTTDEHALGSRPGSAHSTIQILQAIGEVPMHSEKGLAKKKRRSSLSDLKTLQTAVEKTEITPTLLKKPPATPPINDTTLGKEVPNPEKSDAVRSNSILQSPSPATSLPVSLPSVSVPPISSSPVISPPKLLPKATPSNTVSRIGSVRTTSPTLNRSSPKKENIKSPTPSSRSTSPLKSPPPMSSPRITRTHLGERSLNRLNDDVTASSPSLKKRIDVPSSIPTPKHSTQRDRPSITSTTHGSPVKKVSFTSSPQKMKLSSPTKIRERLSREKQVLTTQTSSLNSELAKIGEELDSLTLSPTKQPMPAPSSPSRPNSASALPATTKNPAVTALQSRLTALESSISALQTSIRDQTSSLEADMLSRLETSEKKVRGLDALFQETSRENEALYERFNGELGKIARAVKGGDAAELRRKCEEMGREVGECKKVNLALRRELTVLKAGEKDREVEGKK